MRKLLAFGIVLTMPASAIRASRMVTVTEIRQSSGKKTRGFLGRGGAGPYPTPGPRYAGRARGARGFRPEGRPAAGCRVSSRALRCGRPAIDGRSIKNKCPAVRLLAVAHLQVSPNEEAVATVARLALAGKTKARCSVARLPDSVCQGQAGFTGPQAVTGPRAAAVAASPALLPPLAAAPGSARRVPMSRAAGTAAALVGRGLGAAGL